RPASPRPSAPGSCPRRSGGVGGEGRLPNTDRGTVLRDEVLRDPDRPHLALGHLREKVKGDLLVARVEDVDVLDGVLPLDDRVEAPILGLVEVEGLVEAEDDVLRVCRLGAHEVDGWRDAELDGFRISTIGRVELHGVGTRDGQDGLGDLEDDREPVGTGPVDRMLGSIDFQDGYLGVERLAPDRRRGVGGLSLGEDGRGQLVDAGRKPLLGHREVRTLDRDLAVRAVDHDQGRSRTRLQWDVDLEPGAVLAGRDRLGLHRLRDAALAGEEDGIAHVLGTEIRAEHADAEAPPRLFGIERRDGRLRSRSPGASLATTARAAVAGLATTARAAVAGLASRARHAPRPSRRRIVGWAVGTACEREETQNETGSEDQPSTT